MKEKVKYPILPDIREQPSAPNIVNGGSDDQGHSYRLVVIMNVQKFLEDEIQKRDAFSKKYFRVARIINIADNVLIVLRYVQKEPVPWLCQLVLVLPLR